MGNRFSSFDIFDTCIVRKCGDPKNVFDILSYRVFLEGVPKERRLEFITRRLEADDTSTFRHLYETFNYNHPLLRNKEELMELELACEREMSVPVKDMLNKVDQCRNHGDKIVFISDMYLPTTFLKSLLYDFGFYKDSDSIYISGDQGCTKRSGDLYRLIKENENIKYSHWQHFGDNAFSDGLIPSNMGINVHLVKNDYLPYEKEWILSCTNSEYPTGSIMAGIGRSLSLSIEDHPHKAFAIDIAAPLMVVFANRIMKDAVARGITRLYFCSRDCYALYHVAKKMEFLFPEVKTDYLYTSREALYNTSEKEIISYYTTCGLAQKNGCFGIVDIRSTGKSLCHINDLLNKYGFPPVFGYYLEMYCSDFFIENVPPYYCEINRQYCNLLSHHHPILETFIPLCPERKTIGYRNGMPVFDTQEDTEYIIADLESTSKINLLILERYTDYYFETGMYRHETELFHTIVIPTIKRFFNNPFKDYLLSLHCFLLLQDNGSYAPYVEEQKKNIPYYIAEITRKAKCRFLRRSLKLLMRILRVSPIKDVWWPEGTNAYSVSTITKPSYANRQHRYSRI